MISFFQQLGKVFYSVAMADNNIRNEEVDKLKKVLQTQWLGLDETTDSFGSDSAYQIEIVFDWLIEIDWNDSEDVLNEFKFFKSEHESLFTQEVKDLILKTAMAIAESFSGKNKSELVLISQLESILSK